MHTFCLLKSAPLLLALTVPCLAATYYINPSGHPDGAADTEAIQRALDYCAMSDPGCVIQLGEGQFWIKQLAVTGFHGTLKGMGAGTTTVSPVANLPVKHDFAWNSYPTPATRNNAGPMLLTFINGNITVADISFTVPESLPTTGWLDQGGSERHYIYAVVLVTGASSHSTIERISLEGVATPPQGYSVFIGLEIAGGFGPWMGGQHSVSSSHVRSMNCGVEAFRLQNAQVTISDNTFEDCFTCTDAASANSSHIEISRNMISSVGGAVVGLWSYEATEMSVYEARYNTVHLPIDAWGRAFCVVDHSHRSGGAITHKAIVLQNTIEMRAETGQQGISTDSLNKALIAQNTISKSGAGWAILANNVSNSQYLANDLSNFAKTPKIQLKNSTDNLLVVEDASDVSEAGTGNAGNKVITQGP